PFGELREWIRRVLGLGAFGSALLILLNDTGVTATSASGLFLLAIPAWAWLHQHRRVRPARGPCGRGSPLVLRVDRSCPSDGAVLSGQTVTSSGWLSSYS